VTQLVEQLGYGPGDRLVIVSADRLGTCHAANVGIYRALREGIVTSSALMMPCPWARHAAVEYRGEDIGVQLTLNAEHDVLRWGPLTHAPSLLDGDGGFPRTLHDLWDHADLDEVRRESRAQIERAIVWGFGVTHLTSHLDALVFRPEFFDIYLDLACEFGLPIRLAGADAERSAGFPFRTLTVDEGVCTPDHVRVVRGGIDALREAIATCEAGVTELIAEPAIDTDELRALDPAWADRVAMLAALDRSHTGELTEAGVHLIGYRQLRDVQQRTLSRR
jgi:chitin disaccharide deacetylase